MLRSAIAFGSMDANNIKLIDQIDSNSFVINQIYKSSFQHNG